LSEERSAGPTPRTTVRRLPDRARDDRDTINAILDETSTKVRTGPPKDDEADYALPVWAGEIPLVLQPSRPVADPRLAPGTGVPPEVATWARPGRPRR
jgi:hypothetical protein